MTTVLVLAVLWLIVVVPMIFRRNDARRRERTVAGFGRAMRALGARASGSARSPQADVFVRGETERRKAAPAASVAAAARRPVPAPQEALMYPVDRSDMSAARTRMMARRRRSLALLVVGSLLGTMLAFSLGGVFWLVDAPFVLGFVGYVSFLRSHAQRDRERRLNRRERATEQRTTGFDATADPGRFEQMPESVVRIDDDDIELHNLDTVDLTGLYSDELADASTAHRRAS
ncbi:MAG: hypothetical protein M3O28_08545 [Actinomycetota bacterium]|nr:hypothetical protein [Actinomycetota bacterium]